MKRCFALTIVLLAVVALSATTIQPLSIEDLTAAASQIVVGQAVQSWSAWDAQHANIYTYTRFHSTRALKGAAQDVIVKQLGGSDGHITEKVSGVRHFLAGEDALLFLTPSKTADGTMLIVGLMQGNFRLERTAGGDWLASNGVPQVNAAKGKQVVEFSGAVHQLTNLESRVRKAVAQ